MRTLVLCALVLASPALAWAQPKPPKVRVYIWTAQPAQGGISAPDQEDREDAVRDMQRDGWGGQVEIVFSRDTSQVQVEVLPRTSTGSREDRFTVNAILRFGDYEAPLQCVPTKLLTWRGAAGTCVGKVKKWVETNRAQFMTATK